MFGSAGNPYDIYFFGAVLIALSTVIVLTVLRCAPGLVSKAIVNPKAVSKSLNKVDKKKQAEEQAKAVTQLNEQLRRAQASHN